jgi:hypothetical protein
MNEHNVKKGQIRLEEAFNEAKISEPIPFHSSKSRNKKSVEDHDSQPESSDMLPVQGDRTEYREG